MANTPRLGLHQWQPDDSFLREEFNEDFRKIDTELGKTGYVAGAYQGKNNYNIPTVVNVGFHPSAVLVCQVNTGSIPIRMIYRGQQISYNNQNIFKITETGFEVGMATDGSRVVEPNLNGGYTYSYIAFR